MSSTLEQMIEEYGYEAAGELYRMQSHVERADELVELLRNREKLLVEAVRKWAATFPDRSIPDYIQTIMKNG